MASDDRPFTRSSLPSDDDLPELIASTEYLPDLLDDNDQITSDDGIPELDQLIIG
jgi:hypothetical protein